MRQLDIGNIQFHQSDVHSTNSWEARLLVELSISFIDQMQLVLWVLQRLIFRQVHAYKDEFGRPINSSTDTAEYYPLPQTTSLKLITQSVS